MEVIQRVQEGSNPLVVSVLERSFELPKEAAIAAYNTANKKKLSKEAMKRRKYTSFSYYKLNDGTIIKGIFLNTDRYLEVGRYPFVGNEQPRVRNFKDINDAGATRLTVSYALLIGELSGQVILKKVNDCKIVEETGQIDTLNDNFEKLPQGNPERFGKLAQVLNSCQTVNPGSIRITVLEDGEQASIIDYDPFFVEREYLSRFK